MFGGLVNRQAPFQGLGQGLFQNPRQAPMEVKTEAPQPPQIEKDIKGQSLNFGAPKLNPQQQIPQPLITPPAPIQTQVVQTVNAGQPLSDTTKISIRQNIEQMISIVEGLEKQLEQSKQIELLCHKLRFIDPSGNKDNFVNRILQEFDRQIGELDKILTQQEQILLLETSQNNTSISVLSQNQNNIKQLEDKIDEMIGKVSRLHQEIFDTSNNPRKSTCMEALEDYIRTMIQLQNKIKKN